MNEQQLNYQEIGQNIRRYRRLRGLNQRMLAELINMSAQHISHIENGQPVGISTLVNICNVLEVSADSLLGTNIRATYHSNQVEQIAKLVAQTNLSSKELSKFVTILEAIEDQHSP